MIQPLPLAKSGQTILNLLPAMANRHGLITGATGTGKTVTMQRLAEQFSAIGVPVFMADIKGDLTGMAAAGVDSPKLKARLAALAVADWQGRKNPVVMWDIYGKAGHPLRATISDMGPLLLSRILNLNDTQESVLQMAFKIADDEALLLVDLKDLRAMLQFVGEHIQEISTKYGLVSAASIGAIQRGLLTLETQGGDKFFGEPMLNIADLMQTGGGEMSGRGVINIMAADQLMKSPALYSIFLLWLLAELFEQLPEVGDVDKPKLVFFFDEAHLLFKEAPAELLAKIEQVVRLIRSKGVGVYFVTQNPLDVPQTVLSQLSNRVQHALRAFTPSDQKAVKTAAATLRANPKFDAEKAIGELEVGEALVSFLDEKGAPQMVERAMVLPPFSRIGPLSQAELQELIASSPIAGFYEKGVDRLSAFERLQDAQNPATINSAQDNPTTEASHSSGNTGGVSRTDGTGGQGLLSSLGKMLGSTTGPRGGHYPGMVETAAKSAARAIGSQVGRQIIRGVLGSILGGRR